MYRTACERPRGSRAEVQHDRCRLVETYVLNWLIFKLTKVKLKGVEERVHRSVALSGSRSAAPLAVAPPPRYCMYVIK